MELLNPTPYYIIYAQTLFHSNLLTRLCWFQNVISLPSLSFGETERKSCFRVALVGSETHAIVSCTVSHCEAASLNKANE